MSDFISKHLVKRAKILEPLYQSESTKLLLELFIIPIMNMPELSKYTDREKLDIIFGTDYRHILKATAKQSFDMPGNLIYGSVIKAPCNVDRQVVVGDKLLVRIDSRTPNRIDIEIFRTGLVFLLTKRQYSEIVCKLKGSKRCQVSLKEPFLD